jgi:proteasome lid subunit RPN8/RPN11
MLKYSSLLSFKQQLSAFWSPGAERCGVINTHHEILEVPNRSKNPEFTFAFDEEVLEDRPIATWHTHPETPANLSIEDYRFFQCWPEMLHFIIGGDEVRCYQVHNGIVFCVDDEADYTPRASEEAV